MSVRKTFAAVALFGSLMLTAQAGADMILDNLNQGAAPSGTGSNLGLGTDGVDRTKAVGLTMGADDMTFRSVVALITNSMPASELSGGIYSDLLGNPDLEIAPFVAVPVAEGVDSQQISITTAGDVTLQAGMTYWFVLDGPATTNSLLWESLTPNTQPVGSGGVSFVGYRFSSNGGGTWGSSGVFNGITVNANIIPAPASLALLAMAGLCGTRARRRTEA